MSQQRGWVKRKEVEGLCSLPGCVGGWGSIVWEFLSIVIVLVGCYRMSPER
jgi:hypothetical protein